jgi:predicted component of type VI protein secretion system
MDEIERILKAILRTAEIIHEYLEARPPFRNHIMTLGIDGIMAMAKEAIELIEQAKKTP